MRMCMRDNKPVIGLGLGFNMLAFYCATGIPFDLKFVPKINNQIKTESKVENNRYKKAIINPFNGDFYEYI